MPNNPKVSVIVPVYNVEKYLRRCLDSIANQDFCDFECICVDDGSTDGSGKILDEYAQRDDRFVVIHKKNGGVSSARNVGLRKMHGQYVTFVDADDVLDLNYIGVMVFGMIKYNVNFVRAKFKRNGIPQSNFIFQNTGFESETVIGLSDFKNLDLLGYAGGILIQSKCIRNLFFDEKIFYGEDKLFLTKSFFTSGSNEILFTKNTYYNYTYNEDSASHLGFNEKWLTVKNAADEIVQLLEAHPESLHLALLNKKCFYLMLYRKLILSGKKKAYASLFSELRKSILTLRKFGYINSSLNAEIGELSYLYGFHRIVLFLRRLKRRVLPKNCIGYTLKE